MYPAPGAGPFSGKTRILGVVAPGRPRRSSPLTRGFGAEDIPLRADGIACSSNDDSQLPMRRHRKTEDPA